jgi:rhamnogalacturonyl hydrolase YesR
MAVNYTISAQNNDGSFDYNGPPEKPMHFIDHYHTGFVLRNLHSIWGLTHKDYVFTALQRCYNHYMQNFFHDEVIPKLKPDQLYRIDIHSCSESILCLSELSEVFPESLIKAGKVLDWTISNLQDPAGYFYYGYLRSRLTGIVFKSKIPYMRWGQAWMLKAICKYLEMTKQNHPISFNDR